MKLALSGIHLQESESVTPMVECATELGISYVELCCPHNIAKLGTDRTLDILTEAKLKVACVSSGSALYRNGGSQKDRERLLEAVELAHRAGAPFVNVYFGFHHTRDDDRAIYTYKKLLEPCLKLAADFNVTIVLENEFDAFGWDKAASDITRRPLALKRLFTETGSPFFRLNFDICNCYFAGVEPFPYAYELLKPYIAHCHIKDGSRYDTHVAAINPVTGWQFYSDFDREYVHRPMGEGALPWNAFFNRLRADGYDGFLTLEPHSEASIARDAWRQATAYLRNRLSCRSNNIC